MKKTQILLLLIFGIFAIFTINNVSAIVPGGEWQDGSSNIQITNGSNVNFYAYFYSVNPPITISVKLYDSNYNLIYTFVDTSISSGSYSQTYTITPAIYGTTGNFEVKIIGYDKITGYKTKTLYLTVNGLAQQNNPPVITSTAVTQVNENTTYSYQVSATDTDNDALTYSLIQYPNWLSISSSGLISGTSPQVNSDTNYDIIVRVSDGKDPVQQAYTLTVTNFPDTTAPVITLTGTSPVTLELGTNYTDAGATATDNVDGAITSILISNNVNINIVGVYQVVYQAIDSSGNIGTATRTVNVVDTTAPTIDIVSPEDTEYTTTNILFRIITNEVVNAWFNVDGKSVNMNKITDYIYSYTLKVSERSDIVTFYAIDASGNQASKSISFEINLEDEEETRLVEIVSGEPEEEEEFQPQIIKLEPKEREFSLFQKMILAVIEFLKRLFGI